MIALEMKVYVRGEYGTEYMNQNPDHDYDSCLIALNKTNVVDCFCQYEPLVEEEADKELDCNG